MIDVTATRATTSPTIGHIETVEIPADPTWGTPAHTTYRAHLADGTPAGTPTTWGTHIAPSTNTYDTETKARAAIRRAHRHLNSIRTELQTIRAQQAASRPHTTVTVTTITDPNGGEIGAVLARRDGRHSAAVRTADGAGYLPVEVCDTHAAAVAAIHTNLIGA